MDFHDPDTVGASFDKVYQVIEATNMIYEGKSMAYQ